MKYLYILILLFVTSNLISQDNCFIIGSESDIKQDVNRIGDNCTNQFDTFNSIIDIPINENYKPFSFINGVFNDIYFPNQQIQLGSNTTRVGYNASVSVVGRIKGSSRLLKSINVSNECNLEITYHYVFRDPNYTPETASNYLNFSIQNVNINDQFCIEGNPNNPIYMESNNFMNTHMTSQPQQVVFDVQSVQNQQIELEIFSGRKPQGAAFSYAYIDNICLTGICNENNCTINNQITNFEWPQYTLQWNDVQNANTYELQIQGNLGDPTTPQNPFTINLIQSEFLLNILELPHQDFNEWFNPKIFFWRVRPDCSEEFSPWICASAGSTCDGPLDNKGYPIIPPSD